MPTTSSVASVVSSSAGVVSTSCISKSDGTPIDYPVVQGKDNIFYLTHVFYKEEDIFGSIFMDYRNAGTGLDQHTVMYGHYSKHGQMFGDLGKCLSENFFINYSEFIFIDIFTERTYRVSSMHYSEADPTLIDVSFEQDEFSEFVKTLQKNSLFSCSVTISPH